MTANSVLRLWRPLTACTLLVTLAACLTGGNKARLPPGEVHVTRVAYYKAETYDKFGVPRYARPLGGRLPVTNRNQTYFAVMYDDHGKTVRSFQILVAANTRKPVRLEFKATREGLKVGLGFFEAIGDAGGVGGAGGEVALVVAAIGLSVLAIATTGGLAVDLTRTGLLASAQFVRSLNEEHERVLSYKHFEYDSARRLTNVKVYLAARKPFLLSEAEFLYSGRGSTPAGADFFDYSKTRGK